jgi:chromosome segregation ATPase
MMQRFTSITAALLFLSLGFAGCATNPDPAKGGFIDGVAGLSSGTYKDRADQRQQNLAAMRDANARLADQNQDLQQNLAASKATEQSYRAELAQLQGDLTNLDTQLKKAKIKNQAQASQKKELEQKVVSLKTKTEAISKKSNASNEAALQEELNKLKADKEALKQQIVKLGAQ